VPAVIAEPSPRPYTTAVLPAIRDGIRDGILDADLVDAINDQRTRSDAEQIRRTLQRLAIGDRLNRNVRPKYLQNATATIHHIDTTTVVKLDTPAGRFTDGHINCSPHRRQLNAYPGFTLLLR
jgi:hypothetical protein